jgi:MFS family permease
MGTAGVFFLVPFYAQTVLGHTAMVVGLILVPGGIVTAVGSPLIGLVADRFGHRRVSLLGQLILAAGTAGMATVQAGQSLAWLVAFLMMVSLGLASFHAPNSASVLGYVPSHRYGIVSGLINSARNMGNVLGIAAATGLVTWVMARNGYPPSLARVTADSDVALLQSFTEGMHLAFWVLCGLSLVVAALHGVFRTQRKGISPSNP